MDNIPDRMFIQKLCIEVIAKYVDVCFWKANSQYIVEVILNMPQS